MLFKKFMWDNRVVQQKLATMIGICKRSIGFYIQNKTTPDLSTALKLHVISNGEISLVDLLSEKEFQEFDRFINTMRRNKSLKLEVMIDMISDSKKSRQYDQDE